jgi:Papain family cysteine protease
MNYGLGRKHAPDPRDMAHLLSVPLSLRTSRFWWGYRTRLDQGNTSECVAYSWSHFIIDSPTTHNQPLISPHVLYTEAQKVDEWDGENYDGTSVRAGAKVLQTHGEIGAYKWAFDLTTIINCILEQGPVVVGTNWYNSMFTPDSNNFLVVAPTSLVAGGHAYKLDGVNVPKEFFRMKNSWGIGWGRSGFARIHFSTMERLISEDGEACIALEVPSASP